MHSIARSPGARGLRLGAGLLLMAAVTKPAIAAGLADRPEVQAFIDEMAIEHGFPRSQLETLLREVRLQPKIIEAMNRPAETKPWYDYRNLLINEARVRAGVDFRARHAQALERARDQYGVDPEVVTAIVGIETSYGTRMGSYRVIDALATLGFDYPRRADFFRKELGQLLLLSRDEGLDPLDLRGSYAGAMGLGQFMPSSYREYGVDFDGDGRRDLLNDPVDAIGSVANYLHRHGWRGDSPLVAPAEVAADADLDGLPGALTRPETPLSQLRERGLVPLQPVSGDPPATLIRLQKDPKTEAYWAGFGNFYAITRYNRSPKYAMAVVELSREIARRGAAVAAPSPEGSGDSSRRG